MSLPDAALSMMIAEIAAGAVIRDVRAVGGGLAASTFAVDTTGGDFIVKIYGPGDERARSEWEGLNFAQRVNAPVPEPIMLDFDGRWFGAATIVMSRMPGRADVRPNGLDSWLRQLAHALAAVHETDTAGAAGPLLRAAWGNRTPGTIDVDHRSPLIRRCVAAIQRHRPRHVAVPVLMHGDFHPGNIVWRAGILTGVLDWGGARLGSRWFDLAYCRADVALLCGMRAVRRLTEHYVEITGAVPVDLPIFDLMCGLAARQLGPTRWLPAYRYQGCTDMPRQFAARVTPFLRQALAELGA